MTIATLVKITGTKKLMMKISEKTFMTITARLTAECNKKNFPTERLATFSLENDDGDDCHFMMISLDKYDKQNMRKFEQLLKKEVAVQYRFKPYDFIPDGEDEQRCGINLELVSIRQVAKDVESLKPKLKAGEAMLLEHGALQHLVMQAKEMGKTLLFTPSKGFEFYSPEIDTIADKAAARACSKETELNAEEQAIDEDVEKAAARYVAKKVRLSRLEQLDKELHELKDELPLAPPVLERQSAMTHRRRRVQPSEECLAAADYQTPEEIKAFAVIDAFEQEE